MVGFEICSLETNGQSNMDFVRFFLYCFSWLLKVYCKLVINSFLGQIPFTPIDLLGELPFPP